MNDEILETPGVVVFVHIIAWLTLAGGIIGGIWLWFTVGYIVSGEYSSAREIQPKGALITVALVLQGVITFALLQALAKAVEDGHRTNLEVRRIWRAMQAAKK